MGVKEIDHGWLKLRKELQKLHEKSKVAVGIQGEQAEVERDGITQAHLGAIHEFGVPEKNIPERSFLRATVDQKTSIYAGLIDKLVEQIVTLQMSSERALGILGERVVGDVKAAMANGIPPELKPETIRRKGSSKPLIDTGQLRNSITYTIRNKSENK